VNCPVVSPLTGEGPDMLRRWPKGLVFGLGLFGLVVSGCAGSSGTDSVTAQGVGFEALKGVSGPFLTVAVTGAGEGVALVQGASEEEGGAQLTWIADASAEPVRMRVPSDVPLYNIATWWTGDEVAVVGLRCPSWKVAAEPLEFSDELALDAKRECGSTDYEVHMWRPGEGRWRALRSTGLQGDDGISVLGSARNVGLLVHQSYQLRPPKLEILDVNDGSLKELPAEPVYGGSADTRITYCLTAAGELYGVLSWSAQEPPAVVQEGWTRDLIRTEAESSASYVALRPVGSTWQPEALSGEFPTASATSPFCSQQGIVAGSGAQGSVIAPADDGLRSRSLPPITEAKSVGLLGAVGTGEILAAEFTTPDSERDPDAARPAKVWRLRDGSWTASGTALYGSGSRLFTAGSSIYTITPIYSSNGLSVKIEVP